MGSSFSSFHAQYTLREEKKERGGRESKGGREAGREEGRKGRRKEGIPLLSV